MFVKPLNRQLQRTPGVKARQRAESAYTADSALPAASSTVGPFILQEEK